MAATNLDQRRRVGIIAAGLGVVTGGAARAADSSIDFKFLQYGESDDRTQVSNPEMLLQHDFGKYGQASLLLSYDAISGASPTGAAPTVDAISTASGTTAAVGTFPQANYTDTRKAFNLSYQKRLGAHLPSFTLSYSRESDYLSRGVSLVDSWDLFGGRSTFHYGIGGTNDLVEPVNTDEQLPKRSFSLSAGWTQVLGPRDLIDGSLAYDRLSGYLTDPYKVVTVAASTLPEIRPDVRGRKLVIFKYAHYFMTRSALKLSYRYYWDDWAVRANTVDVTFDQRLGRRWILTPRARYYKQGSADFFGFEFAAPQPAMSGDYRLSAFWSWLAGLGLTFNATDKLAFSISASYMKQTGIDRFTPAPPAPPPPGGLAALRTMRGLRAQTPFGARVLGEDGGGEEGGGSSSISPADMTVITGMAGVTIRF